MISKLSEYLGEIQLLGHKLANWGNHDMQTEGGWIKQKKRKIIIIIIIIN